MILALLKAVSQGILCCVEPANFEDVTILSGLSLETLQERYQLTDVSNYRQKIDFVLPRRNKVRACQWPCRNSDSPLYRSPAIEFSSVGDSSIVGGRSLKQQSDIVAVGGVVVQ